MKKKKLCIAAAAIVLAAGIAYGSGVPTKLKYWDEYKKTEDIDVMELSYASIDIPDDWQDYKLRKLVYWDNNNDCKMVNQPDESFSVPDDCESYSITDISFKAPAAKINGMNYSTFMNGCKKAGITLNRKMLSEIAINDAAGFTAIVDKAKAAL